MAGGKLVQCSRGSLCQGEGRSDRGETCGMCVEVKALGYPEGQKMSCKGKWVKEAFQKECSFNKRTIV